MTTSSGTLYLILIQVTSRALTFIGNQLLLRYLSPQLLGVAVQLDLFSISVLYFSRESIRVALQRRPALDDDTSSAQHASTEARPRSQECQAVVNISYVAVLLGVILTAVFGALYSNSASREVVESPDFDLSLQLYGAATIIEILSEPAFVTLQHVRDYKSRAQAETTAAILKCGAAYGSAVMLHRVGNPPSVLPSAIGQLTYAVVLLSLLTASGYSAAKPRSFILTPCRLPSSTNTPYFLDMISKPLLNLAITLYGQSLFKQLLTQGDALLLSFFASLADQGSFALASNYGSLFARLLFQPVEESSRNTFGTLLGGTTTLPVSRKSTDRPKLKTNFTLALAYLNKTLRLYVLLMFVTLSILPHLLPTAITFLLLRNNPDWQPSHSSTSTPLPTLLKAYCLLLPLLSFNGILDAFLSSVATPSQLRTQSLIAAICTVIYGTAAWVYLVPYQTGARGLVMANAVGMLVRVLWSAWWVNGWIYLSLRELEGDIDSDKTTPTVQENGLQETNANRAQKKQDDDIATSQSNIQTTNPAKAIPLPTQTPSTAWFAPAIPELPSALAALLTAVFLHNPELIGLVAPTSFPDSFFRQFTAGIVLGTSLIWFERDFLREVLQDVLPATVREKLGLAPRSQSGSKTA